MRLLLAALLLPLQTTPLPQPSTSTEITAQLSLFAQRMHDKQEAPILASYTADAVFIDPAGNRFSTPTQIRTLYDQVFGSYDADLHFAPPAIVQHGHSFHTSGTFTEALRNRKTGAIQQLHGTYRFNLSPFYDGHWAFTRMQWSTAP